MLILNIEIDGYFHQVLITGKKISWQDLKRIYIQAKELSHDIKDLPSVFCRISNYEEIPYDNDMHIDFVIDTDTDRIYSPAY